MTYAKKGVRYSDFPNIPTPYHQVLLVLPMAMLNMILVQRHMVKIGVGYSYYPNIFTSL
jgi:hypothetical protein